ncbi:MAG: SpvB/TcaC N-terminal domain-containing protein [Myxococcales bacterium]
MIGANGAILVGSDDNKLHSVGAAGPAPKAAGQTCALDADCAQGLICGDGNGARYGQSLSVRVCWDPSCQNGVKDPAETEVDCGGPCGSCTNVCSLACKLGEQVLPNATAVLDFETGTFIRGSLATFAKDDGRIEKATGHQLRYVSTPGKKRMALLEGERMNTVIRSEELGTIPGWFVPDFLVGAPIQLQINVGTAPDGTNSADKLLAPAGGIPATIQLAANPNGPGTLSAYVKNADPTTGKTRLILFDPVISNMYANADAWDLPQQWTRFDKDSQAAAIPLYLAASHVQNYPAGLGDLIPSLPAANYYLWGVQWEAGSFPSSYLPTNDSYRKRNADKLTFTAAQVPTWMRSGTWQFDVMPEYSSAELANGETFVLFSFGGASDVVALTKSGTQGRLQVKTGNTLRFDASLTWERNKSFTVTVNTTTGSLSVTGATLGTVSVQAPFTFTNAALRVGGVLGASSEAFAGLSEPRLVASASQLCQSDPDCVVCGDGFVTGGEACDFYANHTCNLTCAGLATVDYDCDDGVDNDQDGLSDCADAADCADEPICRADEGVACTADFGCERGLICASGSCRQPSCENGVRDANEAGTDCGGPCQACSGQQCANTCVSAQSAGVPPALDALRFSSGSFTRSSAATHLTRAGEVAKTRTGELRWYDAGGVRLALFEGASTNLLKWSSAIEHEPQWDRGEATLDPDADVENSPDGLVTADQLIPLVGAGRTPKQTVALGTGPISLSVFARSSSEGVVDDPQVRLLLTNAGGTGSIASSVLTVPNVWERLEVTESLISAATGNVVLSQEGGWPESGLEELATDAFLVWGFQLEAQPFPTSYIPTEAAVATRAADELTFAAAGVPNWIAQGTWQIDVSPTYAPDEMRPGERYTLISLGSARDIALVHSSGSTGAQIVIRHDGGTFSTPTLNWDRGDVFRLTFDLANDRITVRGAPEVGAPPPSGTDPVSSSEYAIPNFAFTLGALRIGGVLGGGGEAFAGLSEPRQVASAAVPCTLDPACSCGDGVLSNGEVCDTALTAYCGEGCTHGASDRASALNLCDPETGGVCPVGMRCPTVPNGAAFEQQLSAFVCVPTNCTSCGPGSPCGDCICTPNCQGVSCGADAADGCGGVCDGVCPGLAGGCRRDSDCAPGYSCGFGKGEYLGLAAGTNVCWPAVCADYDSRRLRCGTAGEPCGTCPVGHQKSRCGAAECGTDSTGESCGTCATGRTCDQNGENCVTRYCGDGLCLYRQARDIDDIINTLGPTFDLDPNLTASVASFPIPNVGALVGSAAATDVGTASYSIPIEVPGGTGGLQPVLALQYDSSASGGVVGHGWSLTGLSGIRRCPSTYAQNSRAGGIQLDESDQFCLDGKQLVRVNEDGQGFAEYRTEIETFSRVMAFGGNNDASGNYRGPEYWVVMARDGRVMIYGATDESRIWRDRLTWLGAVGEKIGLGAGTAAHRKVYVGWMLSAIADRAANMIAFRYEATEVETGNQTYIGELRPSLITYGGDGQKLAVRFTYQPTMGDTRVRRFAGGVGVHFAEPLSRIETLFYGKVVRSYRITATQEQDRWFVDNIAMCTNDTQGEHCLPPTVFFYGTRRAPLPQDAKINDRAAHIISKDQDAYHRYHSISIDADGDGNDDLVTTGLVRKKDHFEERYLFRRSRGSKGSDGRFFDDPIDMFPGYTFPGPFRECASAPGAAFCRDYLPPEIKVTDLNSDGLSDFVLNNQVFSFWGGQFDQLVDLADVVEHEEGVASAGQRFELVDVDGDGREDFVTWKGDKKWVYINNTTRLTTSSSNDYSQYVDFLPAVEVANECIGIPLLKIHADEDGVGDLVCVDEDKNVSVLRKVDGGFQFQYVGYWPLPEGRRRPLDANGDGITDFVTAEGNDKLVLYLGTGKGWTRSSSRNFNTSRFDQAFVADSDSDGRQEVWMPSESNGPRSWFRIGPEALANRAWEIFVPRDTDFDVFSGTTKVGVLRSKTWHEYDYNAPTILDVNGDGAQDILFRAIPGSGDRRNPIFKLNLGKPRTDHLDQVVDGLGATTSFAYATNGDGRFLLGPLGYPSPGQPGAVYPARGLRRLPGYIVTQMKTTVKTLTGSMGLADLDRVLDYSYQGMNYDIRGRGFVGFDSRTLQERLGSTQHVLRKTEEFFDNATQDDATRYYWKAGRPIRVVVTSSTPANDLNGSVPQVERWVTGNTWTLKHSPENRPFVVFDSVSTELRDETDLVDHVHVAGTTFYTYDDYGNLTLKKVWWNTKKTHVEATEPMYVQDPSYVDSMAHRPATEGDDNRCGEQREHHGGSKGVSGDL